MGSEAAASLLDRRRLFDSLSLDLVTQIVDGVANLAACLAEALLYVSLHLIRDALVVHLLVPGDVSDTLLDLALDRFALAVELVFVHGVPPPTLEHALCQWAQ
jgi:hypothetical protein